MCGVRWYLVGSFVLVALAGCGRGFMFAEREPWRRDAEVACMKSGSVREKAGLVRVDPIDGPGICGADFPLKVAVLGESAALGFAGDPPRPPGVIPGANLPRWPITQPPAAAPTYSPTTVYAPPPAGVSSVAPRYAPPLPSGPPGEPLQLGPPPIQANEERSPLRAQITSYPMPAPQTVPMGPPAPRFTGSVGPVEVKPAATLACPIVSALDQWMTQSVQPAALRWFSVPVVEIKQISAYSCRSMNGQRGARISEHAFGNALDVAAFVFSDGRVVKVKEGWRGIPEEQGFLRDVQGAACAQFSTVLAPGADAFHYDHIHVDLMRRADGRRICLPAAVDGETIAARAQRGAPRLTGPTPNTAPALQSSPLAPLQRSAPINEHNDPYAWRGSSLKRDDALITGSAGAPRAPLKPSAPVEDFDWIEDDGPRPAVK
jgi:Extensin-like protein C-terminus